MVLVAAAATLLCTHPELDEARVLYRAMRYRQAEEKLWRVRETGGLTVAERREAHDLLARALAAQGRLDAAENAYALLLEVDPEAPAPEGSAPKVMNAFLRAQERVRARALPAPEVPKAPGGVSEVAAAAPEPARAPPEVPTPALVPKARRPELAAAAPPASPLRLLGWCTVASAIIAAVAAVGLLLASTGDSAAARAAHWADDAIALDGAARSKAIASQVLFVGAAVGGAGGGLLLWRWP